MKKEWKPIMTKDQRLRLKTRQLLVHYGVVILLLLITSITAWGFINFHKRGNYTEAELFKQIMKVSLPFLLLTILFIVIQYRRLRFIAVHIKYTDKQFKEAIKRTANDLGWKVVRNNKAFTRAYRPWNWTASWGEMVTIIRDKDRLYINSICSPDTMSSVTSYGWNKKNVETFLNNLSDITNERSVGFSKGEKDNKQ